MLQLLLYITYVFRKQLSPTHTLKHTLTQTLKHTPNSVTFLTRGPPPGQRPPPRGSAFRPRVTPVCGRVTASLVTAQHHRGPQAEPPRGIRWPVLTSQKGGSWCVCKCSSWSKKEQTASLQRKQEHSSTVINLMFVFFLLFFCKAKYIYLYL